MHHTVLPSFHFAVTHHHGHWCDTPWGELPSTRQDKTRCFWSKFVSLMRSFSVIAVLSIDFDPIFVYPVRRSVSCFQVPRGILEKYRSRNFVAKRSCVGRLLPGFPTSQPWYMIHITLWSPLPLRLAAEIIATLFGCYSRRIAAVSDNFVSCLSRWRHTRLLPKQIIQTDSLGGAVSF